MIHNALLTIKPTSVEAERNFSAAGFFLSNLRAGRLGHKMLDSLCISRAYFLKEKHWKIWINPRKRKKCTFSLTWEMTILFVRISNGTVWKTTVNCDHAQKNSWNQLSCNFFSKNVDFFVKIVIGFQSTFPHCTVNGAEVFSRKKLDKKCTLNIRFHGKITTTKNRKNSSLEQRTLWFCRKFYT